MGTHRCGGELIEPPVNAAGLIYAGLQCAKCGDVLVTRAALVAGSQCAGTAFAVLPVFQDGSAAGVRR